MRSLKQSLMLLALLAPALVLFLGGGSSAPAQIVNNSETAESSEDSVTVTVLSLDSLGNPVAADSFFVAVFGGGRVNAFVFADSGTSAMTGLDTVRLGGVTFYYYSRKTADIDGSGASGVYSGMILARSTSLGLNTVSAFDFQVVGWELDDLGDSTGLAAINSKAALDTLQAGFGSLLPVTVDSLEVGVITDTAIANQALDIDEFSGTLASGQFEAQVFTSSLLDSSWKTALWSHDTTGVNSGFAAMLKDFPQYRAQGFSVFDATTDSVSVSGGAVDSNRSEQGGSGDSTSIARWVWNAPSANHTGGGSFGDYLDTKVSGISGGSGAFSVTLVAYDSALAQVTPGAAVAVFNITQTALLAIGVTDNSGSVHFNLDADSFVVTVREYGHLFPAYDTLLISASVSDTIEGYSFSPGAPASPDLTRAYGYVVDLSGRPDSGAVVSAVLRGGVARSSGVIVSPFAVSSVTDSAGYFFLDLFANTNLTPDYEFTIYRSDGAILRKRLVVPDSANWRVSW